MVQVIIIIIVGVNDNFFQRKDEQQLNMKLHHMSVIA